MCGIAGIVPLVHRELDPRASQVQIAAMNAAVAHRGPDGEGIHVEPQIALGHRRLAIIDLSDAGRQPMVSADGNLVLVFNGEIYNYVELMAELTQAGRRFVSRSDSEVILHAYDVWGDSCVERFNGMWAFAIWDRRRARVFASRDRLGVKPFLYLERAGVLYFSSEIAGIRAATPLKEANLGKLHDYLAYGYRLNDGESFFAGVRELPPGHNLIVEPGSGISVRRYWSLSATTADGGREERVERIRELLADAVKIRLRSDVPCALLQSGGLDSSIICSIVNRLRGDELGDPVPVDAFTATNPGHRFDESCLVRELMQRMPHVRNIEIAPQGEILGELLPQYVVALQDPQAGPASFAHWTLMKAIHAHGTKVVLNGQGADEAFGGYGALIAGYRLLDVLLSDPRHLPAEAAAIRAKMGLGPAALALQTLKAVAGRRAASRWRAWVTEGAAKALSGDFRASYGHRIPEVPMSFHAHNLDRHLRSQMVEYGFNQILAYEDQSSMSQGIEIRSPFQDYRVIEFAFSLPDEDKFSDGVTKRILRDAFGEQLPASIARSGTKIGFGTAFDRWAATPQFRHFISELVSTRAFRERSIWDAPALSKRMLHPQAAANGFPLWRFLVAELWLELNGIANV